MIPSPRFKPARLSTSRRRRARNHYWFIWVVALDLCQAVLMAANADSLDQFGPFLGLLSHYVAELFRRIHQRHPTQVSKAGPELGVMESCVYFSARVDCGRHRSSESATCSHHHEHDARIKRL